MISKRFEDKVAVVTGAAGLGIGHAVARAFAREGAKVTMCDRTTDRLAQASKEIRSMGAEVLSVSCDVSKAKQVEAMVKQTLDEWGKVDILVNNAAANILCDVVDLTDKQWDLMIDVSLKGSFYCCRAVLPSMIARRYGRIINFTSASVLHPLPKHCAYISAKAGVIGLTRGLATDVGKYGITVNCVCPTVIWNDDIAKMPYPEGTWEKTLEDIPLGRFGTPDEAAALVLFLASDDASYLSGDTISIGGGFASI
jgi:3-oxoacyl-[acyl-carrier protein] reductase